MTKDQPECLVSDCYVQGQHATDCDDWAKCSGCLPGLAADGLVVCRHHRGQVIRDLQRLPLLYAQLGDRLYEYRSPQAPRSEGGRTAGSSTDDDTGQTPVASRALVAPGLAWMRGTANTGLRETAPAVDPEAFRIRLTMLERLAVIASYVVVEKGLTRRPRGDVAALVRFLTANEDRGASHADWLCATTYAVRPHWWGDRIAELRTDATRRVNRSRSTGVYLGGCPVTIADDGESVPCGGPIRYVTGDGRRDDDDAAFTITCPWCGTADTIEWWRQRIAGDIAEQPYLQIGPLAIRLTVKLTREITPSQVSKWKYRHLIAPVLCDLQTRRELFDVAAAEAVARKAYSIPNEVAS